MKNKKYGILVGAIVIIATAAIYLMATQSIYKLPMCWICLSALLFSEVLTCAACLSIGSTPKYIGTAIVMGVQALVTFVLSLIFINILVFSYSLFISLYVVTLLLAAILCAVFFGFARSTEQKNQALKTAKTSMLSIRAMVNGMLNSENGKAYGTALRRLDEDLKFTDDSVINAMDEDIYRRVQALSANLGNAQYDVEKEIAAVSDLIKQRNFVVKSQKAYR